MFERGALVLVPYSFTNLSSSKRRPVLVLTSPDSHGDFVALPVTSRGCHNRSIPLDDQIEEGKLPRRSWVRTDRVITLNLSLVLKSFASCKATLLDQVVVDLCGYPGKR